MRLKSYHSPTVESAIRLAHIELGDQAVFLGARRNDIGSNPDQAYEVSFAVMEGGEGEREAAAGHAVDQGSGALSAAGAVRFRIPGPEPTRGPHGNGASGLAANGGAGNAFASSGDASDSGESNGNALGSQRGQAHHGHADRDRDDRGQAESGPSNRLDGPRRYTVAPRAAVAAADSGALVSWKKFLRHVDGPGDTPATTAGETTERARQAPQRGRTAADATSPGGSARPAGATAPSRPALPHWKQFVPGEMRGPQTSALTELLADAAPAPQRGAAQANPGQAYPTAAPSSPPKPRRVPTELQADARADPAVDPDAPAPSTPAAYAYRAAQPEPPVPPRLAAAPKPGPAPGQTAASGSPRAVNGATHATNDAVHAVNDTAQAANGTGRKANDTAHAAKDAERAGDPNRAPVYSLERLGSELEQLRRMFESQQSGGGLLAAPAREFGGDPRLARLYQGLCDNGVERALAAALVGAVKDAAGAGADAARLASLLAREIRGGLQTNSELGRGDAAAAGTRAVAALVGPSGSGKTTAVAKLAFRCGLLRRRRVRLLSVDQLRIGAVEPLQAYAELMNLPLEIVDEFDKLGAALDAGGAGGEPELLLIDTPGYGRREWERARRMAAALAALGDVDVHLVLDLRTNTADLRRSVESFRVFRPAKLLFTRLDETTTFGTMLNETVRTRLPLSFVSVGQRVPEDIVPAGEPELLRLLLKDRASH